MAIALVGSFGATTFSNSPVFAQATTAGHLLIAVATESAGTQLTCNDGTWTAAVAPAGGRLAIFYKANCGAGETAPTFATPDAVALAEFSGVATASPLDQTGSTLSTTSPQTATAGAVDAASGELILGVVSEKESKAGTTTTTLTSNHGTFTMADNNDATSATAHYRFGYILSSTSNAAADTAATSSTSMNLTNLAVAVASFLLAPLTPPGVRLQPNPAFIYLRKNR